jgi:predicted PhzF superfamily epimerase YddE/YHI9
MTRPFTQVDVFTTRAYRGNPLAVVLDGTGLATGQMQRFTHWMNLSETTFVLPPTDPAAFEVRAFFPKDGTTVEDPVTGSLNASLAAWLLATGRARAPYVASQGTVLGRSGRVHISRDEDGTIWVGGGTVTCLTGQVEL